MCFWCLNFNFSVFKIYIFFYTLNLKNWISYSQFILGRHHDGNHKRWKANFRCALNSLPDVIELKDLGVRKGDNAFKVYKFIDLNDEKDREEKKKMQMVTRGTRKAEGKKGR